MNAGIQQLMNYGSDRECSEPLFCGKRYISYPSPSGLQRFAKLRIPNKDGLKTRRGEPGNHRAIDAKKKF
jgi:hypothetical protein